MTFYVKAMQGVVQILCTSACLVPQAMRSESDACVLACVLAELAESAVHEYVRKVVQQQAAVQPRARQKKASVQSVDLHITKG